MFKTVVSTTPLTTGAAEDFFTNITGEAHNGDISFVASLRALIASRMPADDRIRVSFRRSNYAAEYIADRPAVDAVYAIASDKTFDLNGEVFICNVYGREEDSSACLDCVRDHFVSAYGGFELLENITVFYRQSFRVVCFVNRERKITAIFVENLNLQKLHYLQRAIYAFLPWYFNKEAGISTEERAVIDALRERTPDQYLAALEKVAAKYDFESARLKKLLAGFELRFERLEQQRVRNAIQSVDDEQAELDHRFAELIASRNDLCLRLLGIEQRLAGGNAEDSEIMDYFLRNRKLYLERVTDTKMEFCVREYLTYFDEAAAKSYIRNKNSYFYAYCNGGVLSKQNMEKLLTAIFVDQTIRIRFCAAYWFDLNGGVEAAGGHRFPDQFDTYRPNPHIDRYRCIGDYKRPINEALRRRDYIMALEQCIASAKSLNFHDSVVMEYFANKLVADGGNYFKALELPDGSVVSTKGAIEWIVAQEAAAGQPAPETPTAEHAEEMPF